MPAPQQVVNQCPSIYDEEVIDTYMGHVTKVLAAFRQDVLVCVHVWCVQFDNLKSEV